MPEFLVETYLPSSRSTEVEAAAARSRAAAEELAGEGAAIRFVRTTFLPDDETCFHLFEAATHELVEEAARRAGIARARITVAVESSHPGPLGSS